MVYLVMEDNFVHTSACFGGPSVESSPVANFSALQTFPCETKGLRTRRRGRTMISNLKPDSKTLWEQKVEAYSSFGLSEGEIYAAFKRQPMCIALLEKKIKKMMGFFVNKLKMNPSRMSKRPILLLHSLEKWIIPRCSVLQLLMLKALTKEDTSIVYMVKMADKEFMVKCVSKYQTVVLDVVRAHQGKIEFQGSPLHQWRRDCF
ncbi:hypothetical protein I3842_12G038300 [Carya illinoinensis]|uniref:Uncharacterized protein n=1 Tax=Carya illinoinensis TaxID=32201 RepID=A0A922DGI4_CARIL|nr:hypothetical protein I3842_12G038300 [Carya illinoinensis]